MKKQTAHAFLILLFLTSLPLACKRPWPVMPNPGPAPTITPTINMTPVCGFTQISLGTHSLKAGPSVIRSLADWQTFCSYGMGTLTLTPVPTPTSFPAPPVDFSTQMMIVYVTTICPTFTYAFTSVCEGPTQITVTGNYVDACLFCNVGASWGTFTALVVPQSSLPVVNDFTSIPCYWYAATPTPTP
jgi:hypothetical protein